MGARFRSRWQKIKIHPVRAVLIAFLTVVFVLIILNILGYILNWGWTGLGPYISPPHPKDSDFQRGKTLWDWLQLLIIPAVLAVAGYVINLTISRGEQAATEQRTQSEREAAEKRADTERKAAELRSKTERDIAEDNQHEKALQEYIDKMAELIVRENFRDANYEGEARIIARARTLTVLPRLDGRRKGDVIQFLYDANLVSSINLYGIDLNDALLPYARLSGAFLDGANLRKAYLNGADLSYANLYGTDLSNANLRGANLSGTIIDDADLYKANLSGAIGTTAEQLAKAKSLKYATMPDGSIHL